MYKSYDYTGHDPVLDELKLMVEDSGYSVKEISEASGVTVGTLHRWFSDKRAPITPKHNCVEAVRRALGYNSHMSKGKLASVASIRHGLRFVRVSIRGKVYELPQRVIRGRR